MKGSLLAAIVVISAGGIAYEILLMRLYAIVQWHHFAYMMISIAMLGFGASGTFLSLVRAWAVANFRVIWQANAALFGVIAVAAFALVQLLPINPMELAWDFRLIGRVVLVYLLLMVPFFCVANCVGLAFMAHGERISAIYAADLLGAGIGAASIIAMLFVAWPVDGLRALLALGFVAAALAHVGKGGRGSYATATALVIAGLAGALFVPAGWIAPQISEYKALSYALRLPGVEVVGEATSPLGLVTVVNSPERPFRHAPGRSLASEAELPPQLGLFTDGDAMSAIVAYDGNPATVAYLDDMTSAAPYHLFARPDVLLLGAGGGTDILLARHLHDAASVTLVELDANIIRMVADDFAEFAGHIYDDDRVTIHIADARGFVSGDDRLYDLIQLPMIGAFGASVAGLGGLNETYVYTVEAFAEYLAHLRDGGMVAVTRWLKLPPRDTLKLVATAAAALGRQGVVQPDARIAVIRSWQTVTLLVKRDVFTIDEIAELREFAASRSFDLAYFPGMRRNDANNYNLLQSPYFFDGASSLLGPGADDFIDDYKFDLRPATDGRPYFFDFFRWRSLPELLSLRSQGAMPLIEWSFLILVATIVQAAGLSVALILLPLGILRRQGKDTRGSAAVGLYFLCLGLAFLFIEIAVIKRLVLFLGHPLYAVALVLAIFLVFAGLGAGTAKRLAASTWAQHGWSVIGAAVAAIVLLALSYLIILPPVFAAFMPSAPPLKIAISLLLLAPLAFAMGLPFPLGLQRVAIGAPSLVPWAWGINGCASVVSAGLATLLAMAWGFTAVVAIAVCLYVLAALVSSRLPHQAPRHSRS